MTVPVPPAEARAALQAAEQCGATLANCTCTEDRGHVTYHFDSVEGVEWANEWNWADDR